MSAISNTIKEDNFDISKEYYDEIAATVAKKVEGVTREINTNASRIEAETSKPERIIDYVADPEQVITNHRLLGVLGVLIIIVLVQSAFNLVLYLRKPDTLVVDRTANGDRVVTLNNREYGLTDNVELSRDRLTDGDKKYLASHFLGLYYGNNPDYRDKQLNEAISLMVASRGREMFGYLKNNRILEQQAAESWQAKWTEQQSSVDPADPFTVRIIGTQVLTRIINQRPVEETHQLNVTVKLAKDELGRDERNKLTGYQITWFGWEELKSTSETIQPTTNQKPEASVVPAGKQTAK